MMDLHELRILQEAFLQCTRKNFYENEEEAVEIDMDQQTVATEEPETDVDELPEEKDTETKIHELLDCPEMEAAHEFLYDIDYDEITDKQIDKVNKLYDLAIKHEFIKSEVEPENPETEETEDDSSIEDTEIEDEAPIEDDAIEGDESEEEIADEEEPMEEEPADEESAETTPDEDETTDDDESVEEIPADDEEETSDTEQDEPVEEEPIEDEPTEPEKPEEDILEDSEEVSIMPEVPSETAESAFTCLYSAMKNGELKTGEVYSNAVDAESAKADAISKLVSLGFTSIEIIAIENGDPANIGKSNTVFEPFPSDEVFPDEEFTPITEAEETDVEEEEEEEEDSEEDVKDKSEEEPEEEPEENDVDLSDQEKEELKADFVKLWKNSLKSIEKESYTDLDMSEKAKFWDTINSHWEKEFDPSEFISNNDFAKIEVLRITL